MSHHLPDTLTHTLSSHLDLGKSRLETLSWLIIGLVNARTVNLSHLASQCSSSAQVSSSYRRLQRFFQYVTLEGDCLALAVVKLLKLKAPWVLCLDRTNWQIGRHDVNILMLAIATRRFRIPLMWTVLDKAGSSNQSERIALLRRYLALFGSASITWLLGDREFKACPRAGGGRALDKISVGEQQLVRHPCDGEQHRSSPRWACLSTQDPAPQACRPQAAAKPAGASGDHGRVLGHPAQLRRQAAQRR